MTLAPVLANHLPAAAVQAVQAALHQLGCRLLDRGCPAGAGLALQCREILAEMAPIMTVFRLS